MPDAIFRTVTTILVIFIVFLDIFHSLHFFVFLITLSVNVSYISCLLFVPFALVN